MSTYYRAARFKPGILGDDESPNVIVVKNPTLSFGCRNGHRMETALDPRYEVCRYGCGKVEIVAVIIPR